VLANEQVIDGRGWRSGALVEKRKLNQWFLKITDFADELLEGLSSLEHWPEKVKLMQENWIGKSQGLQFRFKPMPPFTDDIEVYTTRPDTIRRQFCSDRGRSPGCAGSCQAIARGGWVHRQMQAGRHHRCRTGNRREAGLRHRFEVLHPLDDGWTLPVYIANFVLMDYGTGAVLAAPRMTSAI
jgi:leucyl-tRNA synthetase